MGIKSTPGTTSATLRVASPQAGGVIVTAHPDVTYQEVVEERDDIIQTLHAAYLTLNASMAQFQRHWDADPKAALMEAVIEGAKDGGATWLAEQADFFDWDNLTSLYQKASTFTSSSLDTLYVYGRRQYNDIERQLGQVVNNPGATLGNWAFWQSKLEKKAAEHEAMLRALQDRATQTVRAVAGGVDKAQMIYKYRAQIMNLPHLIARNDVAAIQSFVEVELMAIDKELATEIRGDKRFAIVLEVLNDPESVVTYLAYAGMMIDAIPPNFYAYIAGKGAMYLIFEIVLLVVTAILSAGAAAAGRVAMLVARVGATSARVSGATRVYKGAKTSVAGFVRAVEDLETSIKAVHQLAPKAMRVNQKGVVGKGATGQQIALKRESIKRNPCCRICHSEKHSTPTHRRGTVVYK